ncbi:RDD family protein [uncultured Thomasclavelia sp.]|uniref:RDD family protein n=1 Tax=uncultured Thomasclavelia sp. TaxID=3025759 RepID=UPI0025DA211B|nr:RDD family protein [uncultured Thomasclavelia sp.]
MKKILELRNKEEKNDLSQIRRFIAYAIDWYLGGVVASLPIIIIYMMLHDDATSIPQNIAIFDYPYNFIAGGLSFLVAIIYYVIVPLKVFPGQTVGKRILKLKIVNNNYLDVSIKQIIIRQLVMIILIEGSIYSCSNMLHQLINTATNFNFSGIYAYIGLVISLISAILVLVLKSKRALHDLVAGTKVVYLDSNQYVVATRKMKKKLRKNLKLANG